MCLCLQNCVNVWTSRHACSLAAAELWHLQREQGREEEESREAERQSRRRKMKEFDTIMIGQRADWGQIIPNIPPKLSAFTFLEKCIFREKN